MTITLTTKQAHVLVNALDIYSRIGLGQTEALAQGLQELHPGIHYWDIVHKHTDPIKQELFGFTGGASYGVGNPKVSDAASIAYDLQCVIRKCVAQVEDHSTSSVWHSEPLHYGSEPLATALAHKYEFKKSTDVRVMAAAIKDHDGKVYHVEQPGRHHDVIRLMVRAGCKKPVTGTQGFLLSDGQFVGRIAARFVAMAAGQLLPRDSKLKELFSEDVW